MNTTNTITTNTKMINIEEQYLELLTGVLYSGKKKEDRTGHGTISRFGGMIEHDMSLGFPLLTTKKMFFNMVRTELMWILNGRTDMQYLWDRNVRYWDHDYARSGRTDGSLGPVYGKQWRDFNGVDQLQELLINIIENPSSRRLMVNAWNPGKLPKMVLPPCHYGFQVYINNGKLDLMWQQRSVDMFLGLPYDIAMYGLLLVLLADFGGYKPGRLIGQLGDCHIYNNHIDAVKEQLSRKPTKLPDISFENGIKMVGYYGNVQRYLDITIPEPEQINILNYKPQPAIKAEFPNELN
jgi:thymidylate synthase